MRRGPQEQNKYLKEAKVVFSSHSFSDIEIFLNSSFVKYQLNIINGDYHG